MASALIPTVYDCPFAQRHDYRTRTRCDCCLRRFESDLGSDSGIDVSSIASKISGLISAVTLSRNSSTASSSSKYSNKQSLELLEANLLLAPRLVPNKSSAKYEINGLEKVCEWEGWTKLNAWQKKMRRGGFGGTKVSRKMVRSSISDLD